MKLLQLVVQQQEEQGKILKSISSRGEYSTNLPAAAGGGNGMLLEALQVRANKKVRIDNDARATVKEAPTALYGGLESAAMVAACAVESETQRKRVVAFQEFSNWLVPKKRALGLSEDAYQATPEDLVAYHHNYWIHCHGETWLKGRKWPAPGSLEGNFSHLSAMFESVGRSSNYSSELSIGNPVLSKIVRDYKEGYARLMRDLGFATTSAVHMKEEKLVRVILNEDAVLREERRKINSTDRTTVVKYLLKERDLVMLCGLWQCSCRGKEMGVLEEERVQDRDGESVYPGLVGIEIVAGRQYQIAPKGTKTVQRNRAGVILLEAETEERKALCLLRRLQQHARSCEAAGVSESRYLIRPEASNHEDLKDEGMSSSAMNKRMQALLKKHGEFSGETLHGVRRGTMQHQAAMGKTVEEIGAKALQVTREVTVAYLDTSRETYGSKRRRE